MDTEEVLRKILRRTQSVRPYPTRRLRLRQRRALVDRSLMKRRHRLTPAVFLRRSHHMWDPEVVHRRWVVPGKTVLVKMKPTRLHWSRRPLVELISPFKPQPTISGGCEWSHSLKFSLTTYAVLLAASPATRVWTGRIFPWQRACGSSVRLLHSQLAVLATYLAIIGALKRVTISQSSSRCWSSPVSTAITVGFPTLLRHTLEPGSIRLASIGCYLWQRRRNYDWVSLYCTCILCGDDGVCLNMIVIVRMNLVFLSHGTSLYNNMGVCL